MSENAITGVEDYWADHEAECSLECWFLVEGHEEEEKTSHNQHAQEGAIDGDNHHHDATIIDKLDNLTDTPEAERKKGQPENDKQWLVFQNFLQSTMSFCDIDCDVDKSEYIEEMSDEEG